MGRGNIICTVVVLCCLHGHAEEPYSVGLENMAQTLRGDVRVITMGDSYSGSWFFRVPPACLKAWPIPRITALEGGARQHHDIIRALEMSNQVEQVASSDTFGFTVERQEVEPSYFALPLRGMREIYANKTLVLGNANRLLEFRLQNYRFESGVHGPFSSSGDDVRFRLLYRCPSVASLQLPVVELQDYWGDLTHMDLTENARGFLHLDEDPLVGRSPIPGQINAALPDIDVNNDVATLLRVGVSTYPSFVGSNTYLDAAGAVYYHTNERGERLPGLYYSYLADDSWSYDGFCSDHEATHAFDKSFSHEQVVHWLDATTLDSTQPVVFFWYLAAEDIGYTQALAVFEQMIDAMDHAGEEVGLFDVQHLLVIPHMYYFNGGLGDSPVAHGYMQGQQDAAFALAHERSNVAAASIYAATDAVLFDGEQECLDWLNEHGFDNFQLGSLQANLVEPPISGHLLDASRVHPLGEEGAGFFAAVLGDMIREAGCPADIVENGIIDVHDLLSVIADWGKQGESDINQDGLINIEDLLLLIATWGDCWPMQAPFDTTTN